MIDYVEMALLGFATLAPSLWVSLLGLGRGGSYRAPHRPVLMFAGLSFLCSSLTAIVIGLAWSLIALVRMLSR